MTDMAQIRHPPHVFTLRGLAIQANAWCADACALTCEWWRRYRSRLELASYSYDQRKDLNFSADVDGEIAKPFWKN